jgi:hypothetical protein
MHWKSAVYFNVETRHQNCHQDIQSEDCYIKAID